MIKGRGVTADNPREVYAIMKEEVGGSEGEEGGSKRNEGPEEAEGENMKGEEEEVIEVEGKRRGKGG